MDEKFRCSLCLDRFNDPRILSCFHTFCRDCLKDYLTKSTFSAYLGTSFECPLCRTRNHLPTGGVDSLQKNFYLDEPVKQEVEPSFQMCAVHPKEDLRFFCCSCRQCICRDCKIVSHEGHETDMVDNVGTAMRLTLEESLSDTKMDINEIETRLTGAFAHKINELEATMAVLKQNAMDIKKEIDSILEETLGLIQPQCDREKRTLSNIENHAEEKRKQLSEYKQLLIEATETKKHDSIFKLFETLIDQEELERMKTPPAMPKHDSAEEELDGQRLKAAFQRLTKTIMHGLREFKTKDIRQGQVESQTEKRFDEFRTSRASKEDNSGYRKMSDKLPMYSEKLKNSLCQSVEEKYGGQNQGQTQARGHRQTTQKVWLDAEKSGGKSIVYIEEEDNAYENELWNSWKEKQEKDSNLKGTVEISRSRIGGSKQKQTSQQTGWQQWCHKPSKENWSVEKPIGHRDQKAKNSMVKRNSKIIGEIEINFNDGTRILENDEGACITGGLSRFTSLGPKMGKHRLTITQKVPTPRVDDDTEFPTLAVGENK